MKKMGDSILGTIVPYKILQLHFQEPQGHNLYRYYKQENST